MNFMNLVILITVIIFVVSIFKNQIKKAEFGTVLSDSSTEEKTALDDIVEMEDAFFEAVKNGREAVKFMHLFYGQDIMMLKAAFQSEGIPYKIENEHLPQVLTGQGVIGFYHSDFYILKEDYEDALKIVQEYVENKKNGGQSEAANKAVCDLISIVTASSYVPDKTETAGIVIFKLED